MGKNPRVTVLPPDLEKCRELRAVSAGHCALVDPVRPRVLLLPLLESLAVQGNCLTALPSEMVATPRLKYVNASGNPNLVRPPLRLMEEGPASIGNARRFFREMEQAHRDALAAAVAARELEALLPALVAFLRLRERDSLVLLRSAEDDAAAVDGRALREQLELEKRTLDKMARASAVAREALALSDPTHPESAIELVAPSIGPLRTAAEACVDGSLASHPAVAACYRQLEELDAAVENFAATSRRQAGTIVALAAAVQAAVPPADDEAARRAHRRGLSARAAADVPAPDDPGEALRLLVRALGDAKRTFIPLDEPSHAAAIALEDGLRFLIEERSRQGRALKRLSGAPPGVSVSMLASWTKNLPADAVLTAAASDRIGQMCADSAKRKLLKEAKAERVVTALLQSRHCEGRPCRSSALGVLGSLSHANPAGQAALLQCGAVPTLALHVKIPQQDDADALRALCALFGGAPKLKGALQTCGPGLICTRVVEAIGEDDNADRVLWGAYAVGVLAGGETRYYQDALDKAGARGAILPALKAAVKRSGGDGGKLLASALLDAASSLAEDNRAVRNALLRDGILDVVRGSGGAVAEVAFERAGRCFEKSARRAKK